MGTSCCGFPVCLSGIQILPQARPPHQQVRSSSGLGIRVRASRHGASTFSDAPNLASDSHASRSLNRLLAHQPCTNERENERTTESEGKSTTDVRHCGYSLNRGEMKARTTDIGKRGYSLSYKGEIKGRWPRLAVAKEMADIDRRREAIKKQRHLQSVMYLMEEYRLVCEQNRLILACFESQSSLNKNICAKAA